MFVIRPFLGLREGLLIVLSVLLTVMMTVSCGGKTTGDEPDVISTSDETVLPATTPVAVVTRLPSTIVVAEPSPTISVPPATSESEVVDEYLAVPEMDVQAVNIRLCAISSSVGGSVFGTAPAPTVVPLPSDGRGSELIKRDGQQFLAELTSTLRATIGLNELFVEHWDGALTVRQQAAILHTFGNRLALLCGAANNVTPSLEFSGAYSQFTDSLRTRHAWVVLAVEELQCCGNATGSKFQIGNTLTSQFIVDASLEIGSVRDELGLTKASEANLHVVNSLLGISLELSDEVIAVRNSIDVLVLSETEMNGLAPESLGPSSWGHGEAFRIRRFRNRDSMTAAEALEFHQQIVASYGTIGSVSSVSYVIGDAVETSFISDEIEWSMLVRLFIVGEFSYVVELGCRDINSESCELLGDVAASVSNVAK